MKTFIALSALLCYSSALASQSVIGQWSIHSAIAGNESDQLCTLDSTGNKISGTCNFQGKSLQVIGDDDGKITK